MSTQHSDGIMPAKTTRREKNMNPELALAEYEAVIHRAQATVAYVAPRGADPAVIRYSLNLLNDEDLKRINRTQARLAHQLRHRQDLLMRVSDYTENAVGAIQAGPTAAAPSEPSGQPEHNTHEAVAVARLLFPIVNLEAMRQMEGEVISRPRHDETRAEYIDTLLNLYDQTVAWGRRLKASPIAPERVRDLGLEQLLQHSAEAAQHGELMADRYREQSFRRGTAYKTMVDRLLGRALPSECAAKIPARDLSAPEMQAICEAATTALRAMDHLIDGWAAGGLWEAVWSGRQVAQHYAERTLSKVAGADLEEENETNFESHLDLAVATDELQQAAEQILSKPAQPVHHPHEEWTDQMADANRSYSATAALTGHATALNGLLTRMRQHPDAETAAAIASAVWVNENVIREALNIEPPGCREEAAVWHAAQETLDELDASETPASQEIGRLRPRRLSPSLRSPLIADQVADETGTNRYHGEYGTQVKQVEGTPPEEWIFQYQLQGALHAKLLGEPYDHEIDELVVLEHMEDVERLAAGRRGLIEPEFKDDVRDLAARTRELASWGLHNTPEPMFRMALSRMFELTGRTAAVHAVIDALTGSRPSASRYLKDVYHSGSYFLQPHECQAIVEAAKDAGVPAPAITEMCHRLGLTEETMLELGVLQSYQVPGDRASDAVSMIYALGRLGGEAAEEAARQLGYGEELVQNVVIGEDDDDDED